MKLLCILTAAVAFTFAGCDSKRENAAEAQADALEEQADATREATEKKADAIESAGKQGVDNLNPNTPADRKAEAVRDAGEAKADALENKADVKEEQK